MTVALVGGAPGIVAIVKFFRERTKIKCNLESIIIGDFVGAPFENPHSVVNAVMVVLGLNVTNKGESVAPRYFDLEVLIDGQWKTFKRTIIPPGTKFQSDGQNINVPNPHERDLQRFNEKINRGDSIFGFLMFIHEKVKREQLSTPLEMKITCMDSLGRKHISREKFDHRPEGTSYLNPKLGIAVSKKIK